MMEKILLYISTSLALLLLQLQPANTQGYRIETLISGAGDNSLILSYRYGSKFYSLDTAMTNRDGLAVFEDTASIERGMYQIILPDRSFIDFFIDDTRELSIHTVKSALIDSLSSPDNAMNNNFFRWQARNQELRRNAQELQQKLESTEPGSAGYELLRSEMEEMQTANEKLWDGAVASLRGSLPGKFLAGMRPVKIPREVSLRPDGRIDQMAQYEYYKTHFMDHIDWSDEALIRTPLIYSRLEQFFKKVVPAIPDSVIRYVDITVGKAAVNPEMFRFVVQYLLNNYSEPEIMGMDAVYVHIAENYYLSGKAFWVDEKNLTEIERRVKVIKPLMIGQRAPALQGLETPEGEVINLYDIKAGLTILYFWEPDCTFCVTATPKLMEAYKVYKDRGVQVIAVNTRLEKEEWTTFIAEHELTWINVYAPNTVRDVLTIYEAFSTPKLFILDSDKKIIAKDIGVDQVPQVLDHLLKSR